MLNNGGTMKSDKRKVKYNIFEPDPDNKTEQVLAYLIKNGTITSWEAITNFRATRLSGIIFNLKRKFKILSEDVKNNDKNSSSHALYTFVPRSSDKRFLL